MICIKHSLAAGLLLAVSLSASAQQAAFTPIGDLRSGYFAMQRDERDGSSSSTDEFRLRARLGLAANWGAQWQGAARVAGLYSSEEGNHGFAIKGFAFRHDKATPTGGLDPGLSTLDQAWLRYNYSPTSSLTVGRMQTAFVLQGVASKSLDRNTSSNTEINWTDGLYWRQTLNAGWQLHLIADHNARQGPSETRRAPLFFDDSGNRWSGYLAIDNAQPWGPVVQRSLSISYLPDSLYAEGRGGNTDDYLSVTVRGAARWPLADSGQALLLGVEAGYAPNTPKKQRPGGNFAGDSGGKAWQIALNWLEIRPGHGLALVGARSEGGWLISPDFRPNERLLEIRYQWKIAARHSLEARLRQRQELQTITGAVDKRSDVDGYLRYTFRL